MTRQMFKSDVLPLKNKLFRYAFRIVNDQAEAEDVVQEVFIKLWNYRDKMDDVNNLKAWCYRATRNLCIDKLRSKHRRLEPIKEGAEWRDENPNPYHQTVRNDLLETIKDLMDKLPEKQRMVMQLRDIEGMTYQEVADALDISLDQVKVNIYRARISMRKSLEQLNLTPKNL